MCVRRIILGLTVLVALGAATGCTSSMTPGPLDAVRPASDRPRAGNVYLLRGFIGVFSKGVDDLGRQINASGVRAHVYQDDQWSSLARRIRATYQAAPDAEPLVLIGHSYGADDVIRVARALDDAGIEVDLLVTLDPVTPPRVPKNVRHVLNLYQSNGVRDVLPFLRGVPVKPERGFAGRLDNFDLRRDRRDLLEPGTGHFNIEKKGPVHEEVVGHVLITCPPRQTWLATRGKLPVPPAHERSVRNARLAGAGQLEAESAATGSPVDDEAADAARPAGHRVGRAPD